MVHVSPKNMRASPNATDGPLGGLAVAVKDNISTADMPTTCASAMLSGARDFDHTVDMNHLTRRVCRVYAPLRRDSRAAPA